MKRLGSLSIALAVAFLASSAQAAKYDIDKVHSSVSFKVKHLGTWFQGGFTDFSGTVDYDEKAPAKSSVEATIQIASIDTRSSKRDDHLKSPDFFDAAKYPVMTFKSAKVTKAGKDKLAVAGVLSLHGVDKPVTLDVETSGDIDAPGGGVKAGFSATTTIKRSDFGIIWNKTLEKGGFILGDEVKISIDIEAAKAEAAK